MLISQYNPNPLVSPVPCNNIEALLGLHLATEDHMKVGGQESLQLAHDFAKTAVVVVKPILVLAQKTEKGQGSNRVGQVKPILVVEHGKHGTVKQER